VGLAQTQHPHLTSPDVAAPAVLDKHPPAVSTGWSSGCLVPAGGASDAVRVQRGCSGSRRPRWTWRGPLQSVCAREEVQRAGWWIS
jgi:hypothetical protein